MDIKFTKAYVGSDSRNSFYIAVVFLFIALALRLSSLTLNSFWHDELFTVGFVLAPIKEKFHMLIHDVHPPLFNIIVYFWSLLWGKSEFALRMLSALIGAITIPISFIIFRKCFSTFIAFATATLILLLPSHIYYSQELRSYSLAFLAATIATGYLFLYLENSSKKNRWALAIACALLFAIHYISIFYIITIYLLAVIGFDHSLHSKWTRALDLGVPTIALMLPNLPHLILKRLIMSDYWPKPVTFSKVIDTILFLFKGDYILSVIFFLSIIIALFYAFSNRDETLSLKIRALALLSVLPLSGVIFVSLLTPNVTILIERIFLIFSPAIIVLAAVGISCLPKKTLKVYMLLIYIVFSVFWLYKSSYYSVPTKKDFRGMSKEISKIEKREGKILLLSLGGNKMWRHKYYFDMFGVKSKIFSISDNIEDNKILENIRNAVKKNKANKIVCSRSIYYYVKMSFRFVINILQKNTSDFLPTSNRNTRS